MPDSSLQVSDFIVQKETQREIAHPLVQSTTAEALPGQSQELGAQPRSLAWVPGDQALQL